MAKVALGIADDLLTSILLATHAPVLFVPAMHTNMWNNAITKTNVRTLKRRGFRFVQPASGTLSDGTQGVGHIAPHEEIIEAIAKCLTVKTKGKRIKDKGKKKKRRE